MKIKAVSGIMLTLLSVSMLTLAFNIQLVRAESTDRKVGVNVGYWIQYGVSVTWESNDPNATIPQYVLDSQQLVFFSNVVQSVSGTNVTFDRIMLFKNGTEKSETRWIDVDTGRGSGYLFFIAANLSAGDIIYTGLGKGIGEINETITRTYLGEPVEINHSNGTTSNSYFIYSDIYWNKATGVLYEFYINHTKYTMKGEETYVTQETQWLYPIGVVDVARTFATADVVPNTLNLKSRGKWITCYIELPESYNISDIDIYSIRLNDTIPSAIEIGDHDNDGVPDLMVKFNRTIVSELILSKGITYGDVNLTITGEVDGTPFKGSDSIRVAFPSTGSRCPKRFRCSRGHRR
ncbi:hypothetical protein GWO13_05290 [Candidatus Bathyarchaeota archaeon]|nr:hypothetical protein [Candidatus Bathyarchaeota archaeon]